MVFKLHSDAKFSVDKDGKIDGPYKRYYALFPASLYFVCNYTHGVRDGAFTEYFSNGNVASRGMFVNDKRHGTVTTFCDGGQILRVENYNHGVLHGEYSVYNKKNIEGYATFYYMGDDLRVNPSSLTEKDKTYIMISGRLPPKD